MEASTTSSNGGTIPASMVDGGGEPRQPAAKVPPAFLVRTYEMVDDPSTDKILSWSPGNNSFVVWDLADFCRDLLPKYFKHKNFSSFVRQLNTYGFRKVNPDRWEYANERFLRGKKHLLKSIRKRRKAAAHRHNQQQMQSHAQSSSIGPCVEVGKFGLEEEVERLKRDKNVLMQELVRLRQQQQTTDTQLQAVVQRLQGMEQRQQQMMSFLAKAMNSPQFLTQFLQQQNENNWRIAQANKKRRLTQDGVLSDDPVGSTDGQMVKYQPLMNEAAEATLREIVELNCSPRLENFNNNPTLLIGDGSLQSNALHSDNSLNHVSGVTLQEVPPTCGQSFISSGSSITGVSSSGAMFEIPSSSSSPLGANCELATNQLLNGTTSQLIGAQEVSPVTLRTTEAMIPQIVRETNAGVVGSSTENPNSSAGHENLPLELGGSFPDTLIKWDNGWMDEIQELPGVGDPFWENFFETPNSPETQGMGPTLMGDNPQENNQWENYQHMEQLTGQMGLLSSDVGIV